MSEFSLGQNIGPMPAGAWAAAIAGGLGIMYYSRKKSASAPAPVDPTASLVGTGGAGAVGAGGYFYPTSGAGDPATSGTGAPAISTNQQWMNSAFAWLVAQGMAPDVTDQALRDYISGRSLSSQENAIVTQALGKFGQTPESLPDAPALPVVSQPQANPVPAPAPPPPVVAPPPAPAPAPAPPQHVYYTVKPGDTLSGIAARYPQAWITWQSIFNNNRGIISNPNLIHPGQNLLIY